MRPDSGAFRLFEKGERIMEKTLFDNIEHVKFEWAGYLRLNGIRPNAGSFATRLMEAIIFADGDNLARLELGFPEYVAVYKEWQKTGKIAP